MFSAGIEAALTAYEHRGKLREVGEWVWNRIIKGEVRVVVFGSAGAGKSTLGAVLAGKEVGPDYKDSRHLETYSSMVMGRSYGRRPRATTTRSSFDTSTRCSS